MVSSALRKSQKSPAAATCLRTLDMNYSSLVRIAYEALQKAPEELEEGEEASNPSQIPDVQEKLVAYYQGKRLRLPMLIEWPTVPAGMACSVGDRVGDGSAFHLLEFGGERGYLVLDSAAVPNAVHPGNRGGSFRPPFVFE